MARREYLREPDIVSRHSNWTDRLDQNETYIVSHRSAMSKGMNRVMAPLCALPLALLCSTAVKKSTRLSSTSSAFISGPWLSRKAWLRINTLMLYFVKKFADLLQ